MWQIWPGGPSLVITSTWPFSPSGSVKKRRIVANGTPAADSSSPIFEGRMVLEAASLVGRVRPVGNQETQVALGDADGNAAVALAPPHPALQRILGIRRLRRHCRA